MTSNGDIDSSNSYKVRSSRMYLPVKRLNFCIVLYIIFTNSVLCSSTCDNNESLECQAINNAGGLPQNNECDPFKKNDCKINDLIKETIASCQLGSTEYVGLKKEYKMNKHAR